MDFQPFPSIARLSRDMIITEKLDGTNAQIYIAKYDKPLHQELVDKGQGILAVDGVKGAWFLRAGSRNRWLSIDADNFGFNAWVFKNALDLIDLGEGQHFGEWWGQGIQRGYGLDHKRFSLFNVSRWGDDAVRPACCHVVPTLRTHTFDTAVVNAELTLLGARGSVAAPGFMQPEGVVVFHTKSGQLFKKTLDKNDGHKSA